MEFNAILLTIEPLRYFGTLVILGVVQDQVYLFILVSGDKLVKKAQKRLGVEPVDESEVKFGIITDCYRSLTFKDFLVGGVFTTHPMPFKAQCRKIEPACLKLTSS